MKTIKLSRVEKELRAKIECGDRADLNGQEIRAEIIRRIVLSLPFREDKTSIGGTIRAMIGAHPAGDICVRTPAGISIFDATIDGRIDLDAAIGDDGGPMCPIEFERCTFDGGFSGAHGRFSRLKFDNCRFRARGDQAMAARPSIDLTDAAVDSDLYLRGCRPDGDVTSGAAADEDYFIDSSRRDWRHGFWIRLAGARIDGDVDLTRARLRPSRGARALAAAADEESKPKPPAIDVLNLSQAELAGDLRFVGGRALGRIMARRAVVKGDIWMTGARLNGDGRQSLVLQSASVDGFVVLRGGGDDELDDDVHDRFAARGEINFHGARLGSKLRVGDADLYSSCEAPPGRLDAKPARVAEPGSDDDVCLCLEGARVEGSVRITAENPKRPSCLRGRLQLAYLAVADEMHITEAFLGIESDDSSATDVVDARLLVAKELRIIKVMPLPRPPGPGFRARPVRRASVNLDGAELGSLTISKSHFSGVVAARSLQCRRDVVICAQIDGQLDLAGATIGGSLDISRLAIKGAGAALSLCDATISRSLRLARKLEPDPEIREPVFPGRGKADLQGLSCGMLDDKAGLLWGARAKILMNHFSYQHVSWETEVEWRRKRSDARFLAWLGRTLLQWIWPVRMAVPKFLRRWARNWEPWQKRLDWIYQQYGGAPELHCASRYPIRDHQYRAQPFEQATRVARAEGREDLATHFEMRKLRIEWGQFNRRVRWPLAALAVGLGALWLYVQGGSPGRTAAALVMTWGLMTWVSTTSDLLRRRISWQLGRRITVEFIFYSPALLLLAFDSWWRHPFNYIVALLIYLVVRTMAVVAHMVMRFGFGYLRRPVRAITTFTVAFLIGWLGVHSAKVRNMLVIDAEPVAALAANERDPGRPRRAPPLLMGSRRVTAASGFVREVPCAPTISEPLYALDVLIPIVDLREESRCEVRRTAEDAHEWPNPRDKNFLELVEAIPRMTIGYHRFWWLMKALYAIAGWFIVSLSILTFAQVNRTHAEPPHEHK